MGKKKVNEGIESKRNNLILGSIRNYNGGIVLMGVVIQILPQS